MSSPVIPPAAEDLIPRDPAMLDEIIRQAEQRLQAQLQSALAADSRAMVLASIEAAASAALLVAGAQQDVAGSAELAAYVAAATLFVGSALTAWAARPVAFYFVGANPIDWVDAVKSDEPLLSARAYYATYLDEYLRNNARFMERNGIWTKAGLVALVAAPLFAAAAVVLDFLFF